MRILATIFILCAMVCALPLPSRAGAPAQKLDPHIEALIDQLTQVDKPGVGYSGDDTYGGFIAINGDISFQGGILGNPPPQVSPIMQKIVRMGAAALPALLAHLTDARPTKVVIKHGMIIGSMWVAAEYDPRYHLPSPGWQDVAGPSDMFADYEHPKGPFQYERVQGGLPVAQDYTVRVGDICFGAIGQIVNRELTTIRYQMTACIVVNSPVFEPKLAEETKKDWKGVTSEQLKQSLITDATAYSDNRRQGAIERLCYYYPETGIPLAVKLLKRPVYDQDVVSDFIDNELVQSVGFSDQDIKRASAIAAALKTPSTPLLRHFATLLREESFGGASKEDVAAGTLNLLMVWPDLYDPSAFSNVALRPATRTLLATSPTGVMRIYLNRLLLEDAFAGDVSRIARPPDLSPLRLQLAFAAFSRRYGPAYSAGVKYDLYDDFKAAGERGPNISPNNPDQPQWPVIFGTLFPHYAPTAAPDALDYHEDAQLIQSVAAFPSPDIDTAIDGTLRTLSPSAPLDGEVDYCALPCIRRLHNTRFTQDCASFCSKRILFLKARAHSDKDYVTYFLPLYDKLLAQPRSQK